MSSNESKFSLSTSSTPTTVVLSFGSNIGTTISDLERLEQADLADNK